MPSRSTARRSPASSRARAWRTSISPRTGSPSSASASMMKPIKISCNDHEGNGPVLIQQWDGHQWKVVSDWIEPMRDVVRPMMEESAKKFADENKVTPRQCPSS